MIRIFLLIIIIFFLYEAKANNKEQIILKFKNIKNLNFDFEQNINGEIEEGNCTVKYPKKIYCKYNTSNNKILVSNGKSVVIKTDIGSYYRYPINNTPLELILDKDLILNKIKKLDEKVIENELVKFTLQKDELWIDIFFNKLTYDIAGWQTQDIYQNKSFTILSNIVTNRKIEIKIFDLPKLD